jgi:hypothetical protein
VRELEAVEPDMKCGNRQVCARVCVLRTVWQLHVRMVVKERDGLRRSARSRGRSRCYVRPGANWPLSVWAPAQQGSMLIATDEKGACRSQTLLGKLVN